MTQPSVQQFDLLHFSESENVQCIQEKKNYLEQLIAFTKQINQMGSGFDLVSNMAKPSQRPNKKMLEVLTDYITEMDRLETDDLRRQLTKLDTVIQKDLHRMVLLSEMTEAEFIEVFGEPDGQHLAKTYHAIQTEIEAFTGKANHNLAIRYVLTQRGARSKACQLHLPQEAVNEITETLRLKEKNYRQQVEEKIGELLSDTEKALQSEHMPQELRDHLLIVKRNLEINVKHLKNGLAIHKIFPSMDAFEVDEALLAQELANENIEKAQQLKQEAIEPKEQLTQQSAVADVEPPTPVSGLGYIFLSVSQFFKDIVRWATSSWSMGWRQIRSESKKQLKLKKP